MHDFPGVIDGEQVGHVDGDGRLVLQHVSQGHLSCRSGLDLRRILIHVISGRLVKIDGGVQGLSVLEHLGMRQRGEGVVLA